MLVTGLALRTAEGTHLFAAAVRPYTSLVLPLEFLGILLASYGWTGRSRLSLVVAGVLALVLFAAQNAWF